MSASAHAMGASAHAMSEGASAMKTSAVKTIAALLLALTLPLTALPLIARAQSEELSASARAECIQASVRIESDTPRGVISGSGTVIDPRGYVLTNFHVVGHLRNESGTPGVHHAPRFRVALVRSERGIVVDEYLAEVVRGHIALDLAILKIVARADGAPLEETFTTMALREDLPVLVDAILTRLAAQATAVPDTESLDVLGRSQALLVLHLSGHLIDEVVTRLLPHYGADCPAAAVAFASRPEEVVVRGTLGDIADQVEAAGIRLTAVIVVGRTLAAEGFVDSHLYSTERCRAHLP